MDNQITEVWFDKFESEITSTGFAGLVVGIGGVVVIAMNEICHEVKPIFVINSQTASERDDVIKAIIRDYADVVISDDIAPVNFGTIGHVDYGKSTLSAAIANALGRQHKFGRTNKSDRKRNRANRWR